MNSIHSFRFASQNKSASASSYLVLISLSLALSACGSRGSSNDEQATLAQGTNEQASSTSVISSQDTLATATDTTNSGASSLSEEVSDRLKTIGRCIGAFQLGASIFKTSGDGSAEQLDYLKYLRRQATYQGVLEAWLTRDFSPESKSLALKIADNSTMVLVIEFIKSTPNSPERQLAQKRIATTTDSDECKTYKNPDQQAFIEEFLKEHSEEELLELDKQYNKASN